VIRITGNQRPEILIAILTSKLNCAVYGEYRSQKSKIASRTFLSNWHTTEFIVSPKNFDFISKYVIKVNEASFKFFCSTPKFITPHKLK